VILRPRRLATVLAAGELSEREKFQYLRVWGILTVFLPGRLPGWTDWSPGRVTFVVLSLLITIVGLLACFRANARGDGRAFLERYLCLSVPLWIVTYVLYHAIYYGMGALGYLMGWLEQDARNWGRDAMSVISSASALSLYYLWMRTSIMRAAGVRAT
jgi:hypothetical protein